MDYTIERKFCLFLCRAHRLAIVHHRFGKNTPIDEHLGFVTMAHNGQDELPDLYLKVVGSRSSALLMGELDR